MPIPVYYLFTLGSIQGGKRPLHGVVYLLYLTFIWFFICTRNYGTSYVRFENISYKKHFRFYNE